MPPCLRFLLSRLHGVEALFQKNKLNFRAKVKGRVGVPEAIRERPWLLIPAHKQRTYLQLSTFRMVSQAKDPGGESGKSQNRKNQFRCALCGEGSSFLVRQQHDVIGFWRALKCDPRSDPELSLRVLDSHVPMTWG